MTNQEGIETLGRQLAERISLLAIEWENWSEEVQKSACLYLDEGDSLMLVDIASSVRESQGKTPWGPPLPDPVTGL